MAVTQNTYTGNGSTVLFSFTFPYLETADIKVSVNGIVTTAYTLANPTTVQFNAAPANGAAIRIYRQTDDAAVAATFYPGSAIRSQDLNDNFTQNLYVTQESSNNASTANTTANTALTNSNTAISTANSATSTANTASTNASAAVATANTASANASTAVSTANTASTNATTAINTANTALSTANAATTTANAASSSAASAVSTANTASTNATTAVSTANSAQTAASSAVSTANSASTAATNAVTTANSASSTASGAVTTANTANSKADQAIAAVSNSINYTLVANVAGIPVSPANDTYVEVGNSTGIESFTPLAGKPAGFVGDAGLGVRMRYTTAGATWNWQNYYANNSETRYLKLTGGSLTGAVTTTGTSTAASFIPTSSTAPSNGVYLPASNSVAISTNGTGRLFVDASGKVGINTSPARDLTVYGSSAGLSYLQLAHSAASGASRGFEIILNATESYFINRESGPTIFVNGGSERMRLDSSGRLGLGTSSVGAKFQINVQDGFRFDVGTNAYSYMQFGSAYAGEGTAEIGFERTSGKVYLKNTISGSLSTAFTLDGSGRVGIGNTSPAGPLDVVTGAASRLLFRDLGVGARIDSVNLGNSAFEDLVVNGDPLIFQTVGNERGRWDQQGRFLVGTSTAIANSDNNPNAKLHLHSSTYYSIDCGQYSADLYGTVINLEKSRSASVGSHASVSNGDQLGSIRYAGSDGTGFKGAALIEAYVDGTPGANSMPGRIVLSTTASGASSPTERLRINNAGAVGLAGANFGSAGQVLTSNGANSPPTWKSTPSIGLVLALS